uniref:Putative methyltransferase At1g78140, chloroplastic n=1 Tax=Anthurium amnicola TaxID=1678845 RepID=A0A1D1XC63_9ARAE
MAAVLVGGVGSPLLLRSVRHRHCLSGRRNRPTLFFSRTRTATAASSAAVSVQTRPGGDVPGGKARTGMDILACPICYNPLTTICTVGPNEVTGLECGNCKKAYAREEAFLDLTVSSGSKEYSVAMPASTELFRSPLVSFLYERGWRQNFIFGGFPGPEKEFEMAKEYLNPTLGGTVVDASCGSGMFSRLFASSKLYSLVVALDFSENMLRQCNDFVNEEGIPRENLVLVRADVSRLPFVSSSVNAVHAGAALHCWPSPSAAVAEISRILRPGGVFVATTFIVDGIFMFLPFLKALRQYYTSSTGQHLYFSAGELEDLCTTCGLVGFKCVRNGSFVMLSATKPS